MGRRFESDPRLHFFVVNKPNKQYTDAEQASKIYILPNSLTAGNLFFGFLAIIRCIQAKYGAPAEGGSAAYYEQAVWCILAVCIFDLLDGRVARMGQKESLFGKEFDSIADVVRHFPALSCPPTYSLERAMVFHPDSAAAASVAELWRRETSGQAQRFCK